jgi:hypothetical protein
MERNQDTLTTRDLAAANDPATEASDSALQDRRPARDTPDEVYDREAAEQEPALDAPESTDSSAGVDVAGSGARSVPAPTSPAGSDSATADGAPLLSEELSTNFQRRWEEVQTRFVDEPRGAVEDADGLVANLMQQLAQGFAQERERLEAQWGRGEDISTEDLRVALQRYRSFFQRLLST